jgi:hypothetical protein
VGKETKGEMLTKLAQGQDLEVVVVVLVQPEPTVAVV